jgi:riboflavin biosynthesis pyrimidine reductase
VIVRPVFPADGAPIDTRDPDARERLADLYPPPPLRINLVLSVDGATRDADGTSAGLTRGADRAILGAIRSVSDTVLVGASTLRAEPGLVPRTAHLTVLTGSGDLEGIDLPADRTLVVGPAVALDRLPAGIEGLPVEGGIGEAVRLMRERFARIVCEGGPALAGAIVNAGLADELCVSTSPVLAGTGHQLRMMAPSLTLAHLLVDDAGVVYARWSFAIQSRIAPSQRSRS